MPDKSLTCEFVCQYMQSDCTLNFNSIRKLLFFSPLSHHFLSASSASVELLHESVFHWQLVCADKVCEFWFTWLFHQCYLHSACSSLYQMIHMYSTLVKLEMLLAVFYVMQIVDNQTYVQFFELWVHLSTSSSSTTLMMSPRWNCKRELYNGSAK
jgi:hypothetical protein